MLQHQWNDMKWNDDNERDVFGIYRYWRIEQSYSIGSDNGLAPNRSQAIVWPSDHYSDLIMSMMASQIIDVSTVCSAVCSDADQRKYQSSYLLTVVRGIHWRPVDSPHKGPSTRKMFPFDDVSLQMHICFTQHQWVLSKKILLWKKYIIQYHSIRCFNEVWCRTIQHMH